MSMGLGPISAIYQAHINRYLHLRRLVDTSNSRVWCFVGDGEMDEPESIGALGVAGREHLDNLIFVVNCNLQRLDGPVRGNGKIIQELEALYRGAGWNVIKVIWGSRWDALLAKDVDGVLLDRMNTTVDGEYQKLAVESGAYIREHFFGPDPRLRKMVEDLSDEELVSLPRGGHDYRKLYAAYKLATEQRGAPTVILAKTIKGWTLGPEIEARNATHQIKKMTKAQLRALRDRLYMTDDIPDEALEGDPPYIRPAEGSEAMEYLRARGRDARRDRCPSGSCASGRRAGPTTRCSPSSPTARAPSRCRPPWCSPGCCATSCATPRSARSLPRSSRTRPAPSASNRSSPRPRSTRPTGRTTSRSTPTSRCTTPRARRARCSRRASAKRARWPRSSRSSTAYATWGQPMVPVFLFYSMFGFQRVGDLAWSLGDIRGRGILAGCTAGRTTLMGEGLQHDDGHSPLLASTNPAAMVYDASFAYEVAVIVEAAITEMLGSEPQDRFWYLTLYNETYPMPALPEGEERETIRRGIIDGAYRYAPAPEVAGDLRATLCFSGPMWSVAMEAQRILAERYDVAADTWAVTSWTRLRMDALEVERWNRLHPGDEPRTAYITEALGSGPDPVVTITDYMRSVPDQVSRFVDRPYGSLGTDGFGRSDNREALRSYFEVERGPSGRGRPAPAGRGRAHRPHGRQGRHRRSRHRARPRSPLHAVSMATKVARTSSGTSGTRKVSVRAVGRQVDRDVEEGAARLLALTELGGAEQGVSPSPSSTMRTVVASDSSAWTDEATSARHSATRSVNSPASRLQAMGAAVVAHDSARTRSRVSSICPRCWYSSSRMCTSTAPLTAS